MTNFATCVKTKHTWILCVTKWSKRLTNQHIVGLAKNGPLEKFGLPLLWCRWFNIGTHCSHFVTPCSPLFHRCFTLLSASTHCSCLCCTMQALVMERNRLKKKIEGVELDHWIVSQEQPFPHHMNLMWWFWANIRILQKSHSNTLFPRRKANLVTKSLHVIGQEVTSIMTQTWLHPPITKRPMVTSLVKLACCKYWGDVPSCSVLLGSLPVRVASLLRSWKEWSALEWVARLYVDSACRRAHMGRRCAPPHYVAPFGKSGKKVPLL